ncbi:hypothetical protein AB0O14_00195 [Microbacterium foliorum]
MTPNHDKTFHNRSEYQGERGQQYRTPAGQPRDLSVGERARLMRSAGITDSLPNGTDPEEYGERLA